jgi:2-dehydropantoate 2-reductase
LLTVDRSRGGGSSWQSLERATGSIETDYLTGEVVLRGRLHGVATPTNALLQRLANQLARERRPPGAWSEAEVLAMLD